MLVPELLTALPSPEPFLSTEFLPDAQGGGRNLSHHGEMLCMLSQETSTGQAALVFLSISEAHAAGRTGIHGSPLALPASSPLLRDGEWRLAQGALRPEGFASSRLNSHTPLMVFLLLSGFRPTQ